MIILTNISFEKISIIVFAGDMEKEEKEIWKRKKSVTIQ
jgi:hypothetical protein